MTDTAYRVLLVATHPVQYATPIFRKMAQHPKLDILVAFCSLQGATAGTDPGFGIEVAWDVPLLEGYPWVQLPNFALRPRLGRFFGLVNPRIWKLTRSKGFDAVIFFTGYLYTTFWIGFAAAKVFRKPLLFATDAHTLGSLDKQNWKLHLEAMGPAVGIQSSGCRDCAIDRRIRTDALAGNPARAYCTYSLHCR